MKKSGDLLSSRKGIEGAPFFLGVSALIMVFTLFVVFPHLQDWMVAMNDATAMRETEKLRSALNEIHAMGDIGTVEKVVISLPPGYHIDMSDPKKLWTYRKDSLATKDLLTLDLDSPAYAYINYGGEDQNEVFGTMTLEIRYGDTAQKPFQIIVK